VRHLAKTKFGQSKCKVLWTDTREPGFARSGSVVGNLAGARCFFRLQIDVWKDEAEDYLAR
jgi:hypothetical protein